LISSAEEISTRDEILNYAVEIIEEHGEAGLRVQDIARETGNSTSSIYHFFGNRDGLVAEAEAKRYVDNISSSADFYATQIGSASSAEEFRVVLLSMGRANFLPEKAPKRLARINAIGSTLGRPMLQEKLAAAQEALLLRFCEMLRGPQERGWIRKDVELTAIGSWALGTVLGRVLIELGETSVRAEEWNRISEIAHLAVFFGEAESPTKS
jgi:AcrR family transcriptional regulator